MKSEGKGGGGGTPEDVEFVESIRQRAPMLSYEIRPLKLQSEGEGAGGAPENEDDGLAPLETLRCSLYSEDCLIVRPCSESANFSAAFTLLLFLLISLTAYTRFVLFQATVLVVFCFENHGCANDLRLLR